MAKTYNGARMTTATTGTGTITLGSAVSGYMSFAGAGVSDADVVSYGIADGANFECGTGTYTASGTTLTRTVTTSTNSNAAISLSGSAQVYIAERKEDTLMMSETQTANNVLAAPDGSSGVPAFRALTGGHMPSGLNGWSTVLNTLTANNSASLDDTTSITSTYHAYMLVFDLVVAGTNAVQGKLRVHSGGSFQTTSYLNAIGTVTDAVAVSKVVTTLVKSGTPGLNGWVFFQNPTQTTSMKHFNAQMMQHVRSDNSLIVNVANAGGWNNTAAIDGFSFFYSSGSITSGTIKVYGLEG